jgi:stearoyl-CoA desaturase (delta-9 desaturase)
MAAHSPTAEKPATRDYGTAIGLAVIHIGALAALLPALFSWRAVGVMLLLFWVAGGLGITLGFHRLLTHRGFTVPRPVEYLLALFGTLAVQGGPIDWVATHRKHHAFVDADGDPHDSNRGMGWAHIEWLYRTSKDRLEPREYGRWAPDLMKDPVYRFLDRYPIAIQVALGLLLFLIGGWSFVVWGVFVRLVVLYHCTWLVNSAAHQVGYRNFKTADRSTNCWWVSLLAFGEGWHNNHHAFPFSARHGLRWFEFDLTWATIQVLRAVRIARNVKIPTREMVERLALNPRPFGAYRAR